MKFYTSLFCGLAIIGAILWLCSCSMPSSTPSPGQQAVLAAAAHRITPEELASQQQFMSSFLASHKTP